MKKLALLLVLFATSLTAWAKPQTVTLDLPTMYCAMCPITVKKALTQVDGVSHAKVSYEDRKAVVTFDDEKTSANTLIEATTNAGYPSTIKE
ncbi:MAG: mercury resistance system periplasmic binding protein MerP [Cellvibrionaceae bacterium]